ncbi:MAG: DUF433 domain-containing protein [bacterium]|nr:DUF433 domain-containing protein [bacterium]
MSLAVEIEPLPLTTDNAGSVRVGGTRVTLDTVVEAFNEGLTAEEIAQQYPVLELGDVYAVIGYYLHHREHVREYLQEREQSASEIRARIEDELPRAGFRERLLARRREQQS